MGANWMFSSIPADPTSGKRLVDKMKQYRYFWPSNENIEFVITRVTKEPFIDLSIPRIDQVFTLRRYYHIGTGDVDHAVYDLPLFSMPKEKSIQSGIDSSLRGASDLILAYEASLLFGSSTLFHSMDSTCSSGYIHFEKGIITEGLLYSESEILIRIDINSITHKPIPLENPSIFCYSDPWEEGAQKYLGWQAGSEEFADLVDQGSEIVYLMD